MFKSFKYAVNFIKNDTPVNQILPSTSGTKVFDIMNDL